MLVKSEVREVVEEVLGEHLVGTESEEDIETLANALVDAMEARFHVEDDEAASDDYEDEGY